ncbi:MAG: DUF2530 domain-containing protein [Micromonosporaceae bacterium]|jgi:hypothetical protein
MVPFAVAGLVIWAVVGLTLAVAGGPSSWIRTCVAGFLVGLPGLAAMIVHDRRRAARRRRGTGHVSRR